MANITTQFVNAVLEIERSGVPILHICEETDIDRRNLMRLIKDPEHHSPTLSWITKICQKYHVSPNYIVLGKGDVFEK